MIQIENKIKYLINFILIIWQLPQILIGEIMYLWHKLFMYRRFTFTGECYLQLKRFEVYARYVHLTPKEKNRNHRRGYCMGFRIFIYMNSYNHDDLIHHEIGHTPQSMIFGPLYLVVIGLNSLLRNSISSSLANKSWFERWADWYKKFDIEIYH